MMKFNDRLLRAFDLHAEFMPNRDALSFALGWRYGLKALLEIAADKATKPEPNSVTQFEPFITIAELEKLVEGEG
jgi:hypothetical protein